MLLPPVDLGADVTAIDNASDDDRTGDDDDEGAAESVRNTFYPVIKAEGMAWLTQHRGEYDDHALFFCWPYSSTLMEQCVGGGGGASKQHTQSAAAAAAATAASTDDDSEGVDAPWKGQWIFVIGEGEGGCTGSLDAYMEAREEEWESFWHEMPCWWGIHDSLRAFRRRDKE
jgi:hypothetical protein